MNPDPKPADDVRAGARAGMRQTLHSGNKRLSHDMYLFVNKEKYSVTYRDMRNEWLSQPYTTTYCKLDVDTRIHRRSLNMKLLRTCDLINEVDLVLTNISMDSIESVELLHSVK